MNLQANKYSAFKIARFPAKLESFRAGQITAPLYVRIKPTNRCQHDCGWCAYNATNTGMHETTGNVAGWRAQKIHDEIPAEKLFEIIRDLKEMGVKAMTFSGGGEPLLHPEIVLAMELVKYHRIGLSIITNGQLLAGERALALAAAQWVRVSIDYANAAQMAASRGVPERFFQQVLDNLSNFAALKKPHCELTINFIITKENHAHLYEAAQMLKACGACNVRFSPVWRKDFTSYHAPLVGEVAKQIQAANGLADERFSIASSYNLSDPQHGATRNHHRCWFMQITPSIGADQNVYGCHNVSYSAHGLIGSLREQSFKELWFSPAARARFEALDPVKSCCHQCAAHGKNDLIQNILEAGADSFV